MGYEIGGTGTNISRTRECFMISNQDGSTVEMQDTNMNGEQNGSILPQNRLHLITEGEIRCFRENLEEHEKSNLTIQKYLRDIESFREWTRKGAGDLQDTVDKETVKAYKLYLKDHYKLSSANSMLSSLNAFLKSVDWQECCVTTFKTQRLTFRSTEKDLSIQEYHRLVRAANSRRGRGEKGGRQLGLIMETLAGTGIRISELPFITVASLNTRRATVSLKGKTRIILLPAALCKKLRAYCRDRKILAGTIFVTRTGRPVDRTNILHRMKALSTIAGVLREKIFPHNLRHLFAVTYYEKEKDIVRLADILGHSNINTTRIYTLVSCETQLGILDQIGALLEPV